MTYEVRATVEQDPVEGFRSLVQVTNDSGAIVKRYEGPWTVVEAEARARADSLLKPLTAFWKAREGDT